MKILMIIKTSSITYDERLKKEIDSLLTLGVEQITVFAIEDIKSSYSKSNVKVLNPDFRIRKTNSGLGKALTLLELVFKLNKEIRIKNFDKVWVHDPILMFIIPFLRLKTKKSLIWDLHELPPSSFVKNKGLNYLFTKIGKKANTIIVANGERGAYMTNKGMITKYNVLHNYPSMEGKNQSLDKDFFDSEFEEWIKNKNFAYCQSATHPSRNFDSLVLACINTKQYLLVVGEQNETYKKVRTKYSEFDSFIKVLGKKPSNSLGYYMRKARFSFIFYTDENKNNYLCAPNRMYHSLKQGIPVIVGANPTMKNIVSKYNCGVTLNSFGELVEDIEVGIYEMKKNYDGYRTNTTKIVNKFTWEDQDIVIKKIINT
ncbi:Glycosyltransferase involved in cell wall bisynthesis [Salegentibacter salinarum]|nr:glycosyltransferase family 4 protein [Salegentibacter salinarum]SKB92004.1 Glycosyltransferase involved in cell wall bisynthesis [Salegentibacter salinarum]